MMRILIDTNVVLDYLLDCEPFAEAAAGVWEAHRQGHIEAYISAITPLNIFYIARKLKGVEIARQIVEGLLSECRIATYVAICGATCWRITGQCAEVVIGL